MAQKSPSEIINTFTSFISAVPADKSFEVSCRVFLNEDENNRLAGRSSSTNVPGAETVCLASFGTIPGHITSLINNNASLLPPSTRSLSSYVSESSASEFSGSDSTFSTLSKSSLSRSTGSNNSTSTLSSKSSASNLSSTFSSNLSSNLSSNFSSNLSKPSPNTKTWKRTIAQAEAIYADNAARKQRSMVDLAQFNKSLGLPFPPSVREPTTKDTVYENLTKISPCSPAQPPSTFSETSQDFGKLLGEKSSENALYVDVAELFD